MLPVLVCIAGVHYALAALSSDLTTIPCRAKVVTGVQYRKISWYKVEGSEYHGLVLKNLRTNQTTVYSGANQSYAVGDGFSLLLPGADPSDCGTYQCTLWPPLGEYIQEGQYQYYPPGCVRRTEALPMIPLRTVQDEGHLLEVTNRLEWGVAAAILMTIIITSATVLALYCRRKHSKDKDTLI